MEIFNIVIAGVGGQGVLLAWLMERFPRRLSKTFPEPTVQGVDDLGRLDRKSVV
jgi:hypothetical protein